MTIKSFFFDFGNVVAFFDHRRACRQLAALSNGKFSEDQVYDELFKHGGLENRFDRGEISTDDFIQEMIHTFHLSAGPADIERSWCDIFSLNNPTIDLLHNLKDMHYQLFLASNTNALHFKWIKEKYADELSVFDDEVLSFKTGFRKPEKGFFQFCLKRSGGLPSECVFIDDRQDFVAASREAGLEGILYTSHAELISDLKALGVKVNG